MNSGFMVLKSCGYYGISHQPVEAVRNLFHGKFKCVITNWDYSYDLCRHVANDVKRVLIVDDICDSTWKYSGV